MDLNEQLGYLADFVQNLTFDNGATERLFVDSTVLISRGDRTILLLGDDSEKYTDIVESIYLAISQRRAVSKRAVSDLIADFFLRVLGAGDRLHNLSLVSELEAALQDLKRSLFEKPKNWEVQLIVEGLAPSGLPVRVGRVSFQFLDEPSFARISARFTGIVKKSKTSDSEAAAARMEASMEGLRGKAVGTICVNAVDEAAAIEAAKHHLQVTVDAINFFASREKIGGWIFLPGDTMPQSELIVALCEDDTLAPVFRRAGPVRRIPLEQIAGRKGFARVSEILGNDHLTDLEERLLASVQWAGRAQVEARREEAFLLYAISLESLLLGKDTKTEISHQLAVRCAQVVGGPTLEDKKRVVNQILSLYNTRSRIVHTGNFVVTEAELNLIREYSVLTLFVIIDAEPFRTMRNVSELNDWFDAQLLAGGTRPT